MANLYIFFMNHSPIKLFKMIGITNSLGKFNCSVIHRSINWHRYRLIKAESGSFRIRFTKHPYGYMIDEEDYMALKLADWHGIYPDALIRVENSKVAWLDRMVNKRNQNSVDRKSWFKHKSVVRKFIAKRLVNFDGRHP